MANLNRDTMVVGVGQKRIFGRMVMKMISARYGLWVVALLGCLVCSCDDDRPEFRAEDVQSILWTYRDLNTGRFAALEIKDPVWIAECLVALKETLDTRDPNSGYGLGISVNNVVLFRTEGGDRLYTILGNEYLVKGSTRYLAKPLYSVLERCKADGDANPISHQQAREMSPELRQWVDGD